MSQAITRSRSGVNTEDVQANYNRMRWMIDIGDRLTIRDTPSHVVNAQMGAWREQGVVTVDEVVELDNGDRRKLWSVNERVREILGEVEEHTPTAPCGHRGVSNLGDGEFSCAFDECDERFGRETAERLLGATS